MAIFTPSFSIPRVSSNEAIYFDENSLSHNSIPLTTPNTTKCHFFFEYRTYIGLSYTCYVNSSLEIKKDDTILVFDNLNERLVDVEHFAVENTQFLFMPQGLEQIFGDKLRGLEVTSSSLEFIRQKDLKHHPNLVYLNLKNNQIKCIDRDTFSCNPKLQFISFRKNSLRRINPLAFLHLKVLQRLWFSHNFCYYGDAQSIHEIPLAIKKMTEDCLPIFKLNPSLDGTFFNFKCSDLDASEIQSELSGYDTEERVKYTLIRDQAIKSSLKSILGNSSARIEIEELCVNGNEDLAANLV